MMDPLIPIAGKGEPFMKESEMMQVATELTAAFIGARSQRCTDTAKAVELWKETFEKLRADPDLKETLPSVSSKAPR
jgi:hypothetical protein